MLAEHDDHSFSLTILGERLRSGVQASMRSWSMLTDISLQAWQPIVETVKTGKPGVNIVTGIGPFEFLAAHPDLAQVFQGAMSERTAAFAPGVAAGYDFSAVRTVADIGGGTGTLLAAILRAHPHLHGLLLDQPQAVADAAATFAAAGIADRCQIVPGTSSRASRAARTPTSWPTYCTTGTTRMRCRSLVLAARPWPKAAGCSSSSG